MTTLRLLRLFRWGTVAAAVLVFIYLTLEHLFLSKHPQLLDYVLHVSIFVILAPVVSQITLKIAERSAKQEAAVSSELEQRLRELSALNNLTQRVVQERTYLSNTVELLTKEILLLNTAYSANFRTTDLRESLGIVLDKLLEVMGFEAAEIFILDRQRDALILTIHKGLFPEAFFESTVCKLGEDLPGLCAQSGKPVISSDITSDPRFARQAVVRRGFHSFSAIPLKAMDEGKIVGTLNVASRYIGGLSEENLGTLGALGRVLGAIIETSKGA